MRPLFFLLNYRVFLTAHTETRLPWLDFGYGTQHKGLAAGESGSRHVDVCDTTHTTLFCRERRGLQPRAPGLLCGKRAGPLPLMQRCTHRAHKMNTKPWHAQRSNGRFRVRAKIKIDPRARKVAR